MLAKQRCQATRACAAVLQSSEAFILLDFARPQVCACLRKLTQCLYPKMPRARARGVLRIVGRK